MNLILVHRQWHMQPENLYCTWSLTQGPRVHSIRISSQFQRGLQFSHNHRCHLLRFQSIQHTQNRYCSYGLVHFPLDALVRWRILHGLLVSHLLLCGWTCSFVLDSQWIAPMEMQQKPQYVEVLDLLVEAGGSCSKCLTFVLAIGRKIFVS